MAHGGALSGALFFSRLRRSPSVYTFPNMGTLTPTEIEEQIAEIQEALDLARASYKEALTGDHKSYKLESAGGAQQVVRRNTKDLREEIKALEAELEYLRRRLTGRMNPGLNLRRRW